MSWPKFIAELAGVQATVFLVLFLARSARASVAAGQYELKYNPLARAFAVASWLLAAWIFAGYASSKTPNDADLFGGSMVALMSSFLIVEFFGVRHRFNEHGIEWFSPWRRSVHVKWSDVVAVKWLASSGELEMRSSHGEVLKVTDALSGFGTFSAYALRHIPKHLLVDVAPVLSQRAVQ